MIVFSNFIFILFLEKYIYLSSPYLLIGFCDNKVFIFEHYKTFSLFSLCNYAVRVYFLLVFACVFTCSVRTKLKANYFLNNFPISTFIMEAALLLNPEFADSI